MCHTHASDYTMASKTPAGSIHVPHSVHSDVADDEWQPPTAAGALTTPAVRAYCNEIRRDSKLQSVVMHRERARKLISEDNAADGILQLQACIKLLQTCVPPLHFDLVLSSAWLANVYAEMGALNTAAAVLEPFMNLATAAPDEVQQSVKTQAASDVDRGLHSDKSSAAEDLADTLARASVCLHASQLRLRQDRSAEHAALLTEGWRICRMALHRHQQQHSQRGQSSSRSDNELNLDPAAANVDAQELYHTAFRILALLAQVKLEQDTQATAFFLQESFDWIGLISPPLHMTCLEPLFTGPLPKCVLALLPVLLQRQLFAEANALVDAWLRIFDQFWSSGAADALAASATLHREVRLSHAKALNEACSLLQVCHRRV